ncbi:MAG: cysteine hydrolase [Ruminococcaceae bacterium]|nr:cysteine hydrolase [Oscillospiraceae bacterium]
MTKLLIVVDMQNDFISGALGTAEAVAILPAVTELTERFDGRVLFTRDTHQENYSETQEGRNLPVKHCVEGTWGWQIADPLLPYVQRVIDKPTFGSKELGQYLAELNREDPISEILFVGLCTDICVISNAMIAKAFLPEVPVSVISSCCAGVTPQSHANALEAMKMCQIRVLS